jgi:hypothetical protein
MKQPSKGLRSTTFNPSLSTFTLSLLRLPYAPSIHQNIVPGLIPANNNDKPRLALIDNIDNKSIANVFCFGAFANKNTGAVYNDCTGSFPFMLLDGVFFCVMYHYEANALFVTQVASLNSQSILVAYKTNFKFLVRKGYTPIINVMDNQGKIVLNNNKLF